MRRALRAPVARLGRKHVFNGIVAADPAKLGGVLELLRLEDVGKALQRVDNHVEDADWHPERLRLLAEHVGNQFALLLHRQALVGSADVPHRILAALVSDRVDQRRGEVGL